MKPEDRIKIHEQIAAICYHYQGGISFSEVYNLPIFLRNFYLHWVIEQKEREKAASEGKNKSSNNSNDDMTLKTKFPIAPKKVIPKKTK